MLKSLDISNYAIIEALHVDLHKGLNIITGETGAGKSILLGALGLIMGKRADKKVLYHQDQKCIVEACFSLDGEELKPFFEQNDLDFEPELIIRREIATSGKSRAFVNDTPTTLAVLQQLSDKLIDMHQQFDTLDIHSASWQMEVLDCLAGNEKLLDKYQTQYKKYKKAIAELQKLKDEAATAKRELDFVTFQYNELDEAQLELDEVEVKEQLLNKLNSAEDIQRITQQANYNIEESEQSIVEQLVAIQREISEIQGLDPKLEETHNRIDQTIEELRDISQTIQQVSDSTEHDPQLAEETSQRLDLIYRLQQKHQVNSNEELIKIFDDLGEKINSYQAIDQDINKLEVEISKSLKELDSQAEKIGKARKKVTGKLSKNVESSLSTLSMEHAQLKIELTETEELNTLGKDKVSYLFSANKGGKLGLIKDVASGGEISRLTLVIKSLIADKIKMPTIIFDEIDTGVSGEVANRMADIINELSAQHQVLSITHSPQIAAKADHHYFVHKQETETRTITGIKLLNKSQRIVEIAKMLSGDPPSKAALANAKDLMA